MAIVQYSTFLLLLSSIYRINLLSIKQYFYSIFQRHCLHDIISNFKIYNVLFPFLTVLLDFERVFHGMFVDAFTHHHSHTVQHKQQ